MLHFYLTLLSTRSNHSFFWGAAFWKGLKNLFFKKCCIERSLLPRDKSFGLALVPGNMIAEMEGNTLLELVIYYFSTSPLTRQGARGKSLAAIARLGGDSLPQQKEWLFSITAWSFLAVLGHVFHNSFSPPWQEGVLLFFPSCPFLWKQPNPTCRGSSPNKDGTIIKIIIKKTILY